MNRDIKNPSRHRKTNSSKQNLNNMQNIMHRYEMLLKQQSKKQQVKAMRFRFATVIERTLQNFQQYWNKIIPANIRGACSEKEVLLQLTKTQLNTENKEKRQKFIKFINILSKKNSIDEVHIKQLQYLQQCQKYSIEKIIQLQNIDILISCKQVSNWNICLLEQTKNASIVNQIIQAYKQFIVEEEGNKLMEITNRTVNLQSICMSSKQSYRDFINCHKNPINKQNIIQLPLFVPLWRGLFSEIIMFKPYKQRDFNQNQIKRFFKCRQLLEKQVQQTIKLKIAENKNKFDSDRLQQQMDSTHKIQVSQQKDCI